MDYNLEQTTVWDFKERAKWATHNGSYHGNMSPQIARNIILKYSNESDRVLDPMCGSGTTIIETKLLNREGIGIDINPKAIEIAKNNLNFKGKCIQSLYIGDVRNLHSILNNSIDLILTHPPYHNIVSYSNGTIKDDLSTIPNLNNFLTELEKGIKELYRVLKPDKYCVVLMGDTRSNSHYIPLSYFVMEIFLNNGFLLKEEIISINHNCRSDSFWNKKIKSFNFHLIKHSHLFVFRKPVIKEPK